ncbi:DNA mismatch repair protein [Flavobacterium sp.]|uniref:MutS-related protein n=1 Tax=Flavobacterium sp. TaxID=239 RepID=UPI0031D73F9B
MDIYQSKVEHFSKTYTEISKRYNSISILRLLSIFLCLSMLFYYIKTNEISYAGFAFLSFAGFLFLMRVHSRLSFKRELTKAILKINEDEIAYLNREKLSFENGIEFNDFHHPYAYDLDIFGEHSLFQNLNRTATFIGKKTLAHTLLHQFSNDEILKNQKAIAELAKKIDWRQDFQSLAIVSSDTKNAYDSIMHWKSFQNNSLPKVLTALSIILPAAFFGVLATYFITSKAIFLSYLTYIFIANLAVLGRALKRIQSEIAKADNVDKVIKQYSLLVQKIESENFESEKLITLQKQLVFKNESASSHLKQLSELFSRMDTISNFVTAIVFNGSFLFNLHVLRALLKWKKDYSDQLENWINILGEFEALNSLANLAYNNPDFVFPEINSDFKIGFKNLSHPLLNPNGRVGNTVDFYPQSYMILTGSNMSGKSTFLRSLGINMVLGGIGSVVCASEAKIHPLPVLVSMRLSDSLADSESYFFAEIKRLKQIMDVLEERPAFVLLDEILRGTNSDDKRNGTIEVVKKIIAKKAVGAIATHDIEVCLTTNEYPDILTNQCFEVEIQNNELYFDYKLRNGICKNKSATFLMQKMGVI